MSFTLTRLAGDRVLVEGKDSRGTEGSEVIDGSEWAAVALREQHLTALKSVDQAIADIVAPIQAAAEAANAVVAPKPVDPLFVYVEQEGTNSVVGKPSVVHKLGRDAVILRAIEQRQTDRLVWVNGSLEITAAPATGVSSGTTGDPGDTAV